MASFQEAGPKAQTFEVHTSGILCLSFLLILVIVPTANHCAAMLCQALGSVISIQCSTYPLQQRQYLLPLKWGKQGSNSLSDFFKITNSSKAYRSQALSATPVHIPHLHTFLYPSLPFIIRISEARIRNLELPFKTFFQTVRNGITNLTPSFTQMCKRIKYAILLSSIINWFFLLNFHGVRK